MLSVVVIALFRGGAEEGEEEDGIGFELSKRDLMTRNFVIFRDK